MLLVLVVRIAHAVTPGDPEGSAFHPRTSIGGGMGVSYVNPGDLAEYVSALTRTRVSDFTAAVEFFGTVGVPVSERWVLAIEYAYLLGGFSGPGTAGGDFTFSVHMPTLIARYTLVEEERYNVRVGAGAGYHVGAFSVRYVTIDDTFSAGGPGFKIDCEANTALGDDLFARLGVDARWDWIGELKTAGGQALPAPVGGAVPTLQFFSVGAKLGATWYF